jgi:formylglycine-generating enzyme required for sulfatase activity
VNLADRSAAAAGAIWVATKDWPDLDDGWAVAAPVGSYRPNPFGLHDCHGNLSEWCRDGYDRDFYQQSPEQDPCRNPQGRRNCSIRGGNFTDTAGAARSAERFGLPPEDGDEQVGLRPARSVLP